MSTTKPLTAANLYPCLFYDDAPAAIDWLERAFGFARRLVVPGPDGSVMHAELSFGPGVIMVGTAKPDKQWVSPRGLSGVNQSLCVQVDDPDAHFARAKAAGATITRELEDTDYGSRGYSCKDPEGNHWHIGTYRPGEYWEN